MIYFYFLDHCGECGTESYCAWVADVSEQRIISRRYNPSSHPMKRKKTGHLNLLFLIIIEMAKFGSSARAFLFIQLHHFRSHYLVLIVAEEDFKYALVSLKEASNVAIVYVDDIAWLDVKRVRGHVRIGVIATEVADSSGSGGAGTKRKAGEEIGRDVREKRFERFFFFLVDNGIVL